MSVVFDALDTANKFRGYVEDFAPYADKAVAEIKKHNLTELFGSLSTADKICGLVGSVGLAYSLKNLFFNWEPSMSILFFGGLLSKPVNSLVQSYREKTITIPKHLKFDKRVECLQNLVYTVDIKHRNTLKALQVELANEFSSLTHEERANISQSKLKVIPRQLNVLGKVIDNVLDEETAIMRLKILFHSIVRCIAKEGFTANLKSKFGRELGEVGIFIRDRSLHNENLAKHFPDAEVLREVVGRGLQQYRFERILPGSLALYAAIFAHNPSLARSLVNTNINAIEAALRTQFNKFCGLRTVCAFDAEAREALNELSKQAKTDGQADKIRQAPSRTDADFTGVPRVRGPKSEPGETQTFTVNQQPKRVIGKQYQTMMRPPRIQTTPEARQPPVIDPASAKRRDSVQLSAATPRAMNLAPLPTSSPSVSPPPTPGGNLERARAKEALRRQMTLKPAGLVQTEIGKIEAGLKKDKDPQPKKPTPPLPSLDARRKSLAAIKAATLVSKGGKA